MFGSRTSAVVRVPTIILLGQSHNDGPFQSERLANTLWNYKGILAGYPATRVAQAQYVAAPSGVHIYNRSAAQASDWQLDTGVWQAYQAGVNSRNVTTASNTVLFGPECFISQGIQDRVGGQVAIIKPSFAGVGLLPTSITVPPGPWNNVSRTIACQVYLRRAVRDYAAYNPGKILDPVGVLWWQGEAETSLGVSGAAYEPEWMKMYTAMRDEMRSLFALRSDPVWQLVGIDAYRNANETAINTALSNCATAVSGYYIDDHRGKSLWKSELTAAQASPLTKGAPTNASGNDDDNHSNYIAVQLIGEQVVKNLITEGVI